MKKILTGVILLLTASFSFSEPLVGQVIAYAGKVDEATMKQLSDKGWLLCNGSTVSRSDYNQLFTAIGTTYGKGDGQNTFQLPDYRGQFLRGVDMGAGVDPDASKRMPAGDGSPKGDNVGTRQASAIKKHHHFYKASHIEMPADITAGDKTISGRPQKQLNSSPNPDNASETRPVNISVHWLVYAG